MNSHISYKKIISKWALLYCTLQFLKNTNSATIQINPQVLDSCTSLKSSMSEDIFCKLNGKIVSCNEPRQNTTAIVRCKDYYVPRSYSPFYRCQNGSWNRQFVHCVPECGIKNIDISSTNDNSEALYEFPWVVAIYNATNDLICSGTIISKYHILTAAHCFTNLAGEAKNKEDYTIIAGKNYRDINIKEESYQIRKIQKFFIHENYGGDFKNFRDDIAVVKLKMEFVISKKVRPACIDWNNTYEGFDFLDGTNGTVTGWGYTEAGATQSNILKRIIVPYRSRYICLQSLPLDFGQEYFGPDKICAGYRNNNNNICKGDSGGGLYFLSDNKHYYIRGIHQHACLIYRQFRDQMYKDKLLIMTLKPQIKRFLSITIPCISTFKTFWSHTCTNPKEN
ncbi:hypothetical protein Trydic_g21503 [Trypoxylus dichotomus]